MRGLPRGAAANAALLGIFWFGVQVVWGAILSIALQSRSVELAHENGLRNFAFLSAGGAAVAAVVQITIGFIADARRAVVGHRLEFYVVGTLCAIPILIWFFLAPSYWQLAAAFLLLQLWMNVAVGPYQAVIPDYVEGTRTGTASSWLSVYQFIGLTAGVAMAGFIKDFHILGVVLAAVLATTLLPTVLHARALTAYRVATERLKINAHVMTLVISRGFINMGSLTLLNFLFFYVDQSLHSLDPRRDTGVLFLAYMVSGIAGAILSAKPTNSGDKRVVVSIATALTSVGLVLFATAAPFDACPPDRPVFFCFYYAYFVFAAILAGVSWGAFITADWALAVAILPENAMASAMGIWNLAFAIPAIFSTLVTLPLLLAANARAPGLGPRYAFLLVVVEFAIGTLWLWRLPRSAVEAKRA
jgi:MFS family permease